jgi:hypothetical protein
MSFDEVPGLITKIQEEALKRGIRELAATRSSKFILEEQKKLEQLCADIPQMWAPYLDIPDPASFDPMIMQVEKAMGKLSTGHEIPDPITQKGATFQANSVLDKMTGAGDFIQSWTGEAAMNFKANFIDTFHSVAWNQFLLLSILKAATEAERDMWAAARADIEDTARQTLNALDTSIYCSSKEFAVTFTVVAAVASVATAIPTFGGSVAVTFAAVAGAASVTGAVGIKDPERSQKIGGGDVVRIIESMQNCLSKQAETTNNVESDIARSLREMTSIVQGRPDLFVARRPALAGANRRNITDPKYMGFAA